jgi:hypothetical protein
MNKLNLMQLEIKKERFANIKTNLDKFTLSSSFNLQSGSSIFSASLKLVV